MMRVLDGDALPRVQAKVRRRFFVELGVRLGARDIVAGVECLEVRTQAQSLQVTLYPVPWRR